MAEATEIDVAYEWTFEGLDPGRRYDVHVQIPSASDLEVAAAQYFRYTVSGAFETTLPYSLNAVADGSIRLGVFSPSDADNSLIVRLEPDTDLPRTPAASEYDEIAAHLTFDFGEVRIVDAEDVDFEVRTWSRRARTSRSPCEQ